MVDRENIFTQEAKLEFHKALCFMDFIGKKELFWDDTEKQLELIKQFPNAFQIKYKSIRIVSLEHFNYSLHYQVFEDYNLIHSFLNQSQNF